MKATRAWCLALLALGFAAACFDWQRNVTRYGVSFLRLRVENRSVIGELAADTVIAGRPCRRGWVHLHPNGVPEGFTAAREFSAGRLTIPAGTWVLQDENQVIRVCAFPNDREIEGHLCRGTGGPEGAQASFYPSGALKQFFPPRDTRIDGVACAAGMVRGSVTLHENGRLKSARLAETLVREGATFPVGARVEFDDGGHPRRAP